MSGRHIATAVLALVLTGTVVGGAEAGARITGQQIKDGTVTGKDLRDQRVTGLDIADRGLTAADVAEDVIGRPGPRGPAGEPGSPGPAGHPGVSGVFHRVSPAARIYQNEYHTWSVACPSGTSALGGGLSAVTPSTDFVSTASAPYDGGAGWRVSATNLGAAVTAYAWAACALV